MDEGQHKVLVEIGRRLIERPADDGTTYDLVSGADVDAWGAAGDIVVTRPDGTVTRMRVSVGLADLD